MYINQCGCYKLPEPYIETDIPSNPINISHIEVNLPHNRENLKEKIICEFQKIISKLECGELPNIEHIMNKICFLDISSINHCSNSCDDKDYLRKSNHLSEFANETQEVYDNLGLPLHEVVTLEEYDSTPEHDENTLYFIAEEIN